MAKRRYKILAGALAFLAITPVIGFAYWPDLVEGYAEEKAVEMLKRRFDVVEFGCFELEKEQLRICDIHLEKETVVVDLKELTVDFEVDWLKQQVVLEKVAAQDGKLQGELEDLRKLRSSSETAPPSSSRSKIKIGGAQLDLADMQLHLRKGELELLATANATSPTPDGPVEVELREIELLESSEARAAAGTLTTKLELKDLFPLELILEDAEARYEEVAVTDVSGTLTLDDKELARVGVDLAGQTEAGQSWTLKGRVDRPNRHVDITLSAEGIKPSQLPGAQQLPLAPDKGTISGSLSLVGLRKKVRLKAELRVEGVQVEYTKLAREPVVINNGLKAAGVLDLGARELVLEEALITSLKKGHELVVLKVKGRAHQAELLKDREYEFEISSGNIPCQLLLESVPPGLLPALKGFELGGDTKVGLKVVMKMSDPDATVLEGGIGIDTCKLVKVPRAVAAMSGPFSHTVKMKTGRTLSRLLGRGAYLYTPYDRIPGSVPGAVVSTEDGGFWGHDGFIESQFRASLKKNIEKGTFHRGASTITMQMVKNVLLTQEKTVSRKLQELFLTWVVEERLGKKRIMEIYLNVVEFGPGIYGIGDAADHYFGKTPLELTSVEAAFLATLLPRPVERHEMWCRGELTPKHRKYVSRVHKRMLSRRRITRVEYDVGKDAPFVFSRAGWPGERACLAEGRRVSEGTHIQGALSGLILGRPD